MIRINDTAVEGMSARFNGTVLTLTGKNVGMTLAKLAALLSDQPVIEVSERGSVTAIYRAMQLRTLTMETVAGMLVTTAAMTAAPLDEQEDGGTRELAQQAYDAALEALAAMKALEEGMSDA